MIKFLKKVCVAVMVIGVLKAIGQATVSDLYETTVWQDVSGVFLGMGWFTLGILGKWYLEDKEKYNVSKGRNVRYPCERSVSIKTERNT